MKILSILLYFSLMIFYLILFINKKNIMKEFKELFELMKFEREE